MYIYIYREKEKEHRLKSQSLKCKVSFHLISMGVKGNPFKSRAKEKSTLKYSPIIYFLLQINVKKIIRKNAKSGQGVINYQYEAQTFIQLCKIHDNKIIISFHFITL